MLYLTHTRRFIGNKKINISTKWQYVLFYVVLAVDLLTIVS